MAERLLLTFVVDNTGAIKQVDKLEREVKESGDEATRTGQKFDAMGGGIKASAAIAVAAIAGLAMAVRGMARFMGENLSMAAEQEAIFIDLASSMARAGESYTENAESLQGLFAEVQRFTKYGDTDTAAALEKLTTLSGSFDAAMTVLIPTLDAASATGSDLAIMAETMGKALAGNTGTLSRYGIVLDEATRKQLANADEMERAQILAAKLTDQFGGAAQAELQGYSAKVQQLGNYWGDARESMGQALITLLEVRGGTEGMRGSLESLVSWVNEVATSFVWFASLRWSDLVVAQFLKIEQVWLKVVRSVLGQLKVIVDEFARLPGGFGGMADLADDLSDSIDGLTQDIEKLGDVIRETEDSAIKPADDAAISFGKALEFGVSEGAVTAAEQVKALTTDLVDQQGEVSELTRLQQLAADTLDEQAAKYQHVNVSAAAVGITSQNLGYIIEKDVITPWHQAGVEVTAFKWALDDIIAVMPAFGAVLQTRIGDVLFEAFTGDFEGILEAFNGLFEDIASMAADSLSQQVMGGLMGGGFDLTQMAATAGVGIGTGMMATAEGSLGQSVLGGMMAGAGIGTMITPGIGTAIGAGIGAVVGAISSLFGGGNDDPSSRVYMQSGRPGAFGSQLRDQGAGAEEMRLFNLQIGELYRSTANAWRDSLLAFGDVDLFDLVLAEGVIDTGMLDLDADAMAEYLADVIFPEEFERRFRPAIDQGLSDLGVAEGVMAEFWSAWGDMGAEAGLEALQTFVQALVDSADLLASGEWDAIMADIAKTPLDRWRDFIGDASGQIELLRVGWDRMSLPDRAAEMLQINQTYQQALQGTLQLMAQIDAMRQSINQGWDRLRESVQLDQMSEGQQINYFSTRIMELMRALSEATDPSEVGQINAELQRYIQSLAGLVDLEASTSIWGGETWGEHLEDLINQAQTLANAQLNEVETSVREEWESLTAQVQEARDSLAGFDEMLKNMTDGNVEMNIEFDPTINVTVENNTEVPLVTIVRAVVEEMLDGGSGMQ
jgi:hypothetical protein